ncbi:MAG: YraN family protein [Bacteroidaceae bacterium]|nr:YraN family protein [Bacteroidaceae bacterium]MBR4783517.1 YraN family protein [Bacteroidaceae bacterium]
MARHNELGKIGEMVAARYLFQRGYTLLKSDYRVGHKDIDLIVAKDGTTVFVEVKTRSSDKYGEPEESVDNEKIKNLLAAASAYIRRYRLDGPFRFDIISIVGTEEPFKITHFPDAFNAVSLSYYRRY